jgi:hypothetical protein
MEAKYLEVSGRTYYAFEEPDFVGPQQVAREAEVSMPTVDSHNAAGEYEARFWRRQFGANVTTGQRKFDWLFGVILPVACFFFDPIVFNRGSFHEGPILAGAKDFAYALSFASVMGTMAWLIWGERLRSFSIALSGLFAVSAGIALMIGLAIAPYSLLGLIIVIGVFGFTPFFTSFVLLRNSVRSFKVADVHLSPFTLFNSFILAVLASGIIPYLFQITLGK